MSFNSDSAVSTDARAEALRTEFRAKGNRFFIAFAVAEGAVLVAAVVAVFVLELVDEKIGVWVLVGIAMLGGLILSMSIVSRQRAFQRELREVTGL